jgi:hypothetical protein
VIATLDPVNAWHYATALRGPDKALFESPESAMKDTFTTLLRGIEPKNGGLGVTWQKPLSDYKIPTNVSPHFTHHLGRGYEALAEYYKLAGRKDDAERIDQVGKLLLKFKWRRASDLATELASGLSEIEPDDKL